MSRHPLPAACLLGATLAACAAVPAAPPGAATVTMARSLGTRQCETGGPTAQTLAAQLRSAGVTVLAVDCGSDGRMRPQVCGAADGRIAIVELPAADQAKAQAMGFVALATMPDAQRLACR